eukprot:scaffold272240_cov30-Tisochrysis_lutea.AAC.1
MAWLTQRSVYESVRVQHIQRAHCGVKSAREVVGLFAGCSGAHTCWRPSRARMREVAGRQASLPAPVRRPYLDSRAR